MRHVLQARVCSREFVGRFRRRLHRGAESAPRRPSAPRLPPRARWPAARSARTRACSQKDARAGEPSRAAVRNQFAPLGYRVPSRVCGGIESVTIKKAHASEGSDIGIQSRTACCTPPLPVADVRLRDNFPVRQYLAAAPHRRRMAYRIAKYVWELACHCGDSARLTPAINCIALVRRHQHRGA